ncbi:MAG: hypothetical protein GEU74_00445 [Nitriliruptorales bacterium]|nr:hypothetical protein [Nitriliruptorales bacterium]
MVVPAEIEERQGVRCFVSGFVRDGEDWEDQLEGSDEGWMWCLHNLRLYLEHFAGEPAANLWALGTVQGGREAVHAELARALGLTGARAGDGFPTPQGVTGMTGTVEVVDDFGYLLHSEEPWPARSTSIRGCTVVSSYRCGPTCTATAVPRSWRVKNPAGSDG